jgi:hypothetical protein
MVEDERGLVGVNQAATLFLAYVPLRNSNAHSQERKEKPKIHETVGTQVGIHGIPYLTQSTGKRRMRWRKPLCKRAENTDSRDAKPKHPTTDGYRWLKACVHLLTSQWFHTLAA